MTKQETEALIARVYEAYAAADVELIAALSGDHPVLHVPGEHPLSGTYEGQDAMWAYLGRVAEVSGGVGGFEVRAVTADDEGHCMALLIGTIRDFVRPVVHVWHVRDGAASEYWEVNFDQRAEDDFWQSALSSR